MTRAPGVFQLAKRSANIGLAEILEQLAQDARDGKITQVMAVCTGPGEPIICYESGASFREKSELLGTIELLKQHVLGGML